MFPARDSSFKFSRACQQVLPRLQPFRVFQPSSHWLHYFCWPHWRTCLLRSRHLSCRATLHFFTDLFCFNLFNHRYDFLAYTVTLNYQSTLLKTREEISMVVLGPFTNIIIFCLTVIFSWILQRLYGTSPNIFSRFIMAYGINVLLDPIWILIVDSALMRYDAL